MTTYFYRHFLKTECIECFCKFIKTEVPAVTHLCDARSNFNHNSSCSTLLSYCSFFLRFIAIPFFLFYIAKFSSTYPVNTVNEWNLYRFFNF